MNPTKIRRLTALLLASLLAATPLAAGRRQEEKVRRAQGLYEELLLGSERVVPTPLIEDTRCLALFPGVTEAAFGLGGSHGLGVASCRRSDGGWSAPAFIKISGGSIGFQVGFRKVDLILFFVTEKGARTLGESRFSLGGEVSVAAGPLDRRAEVSTDPRFEEDIYLYARARGLFAGVSIEGSRLSAANKATERFYGRRLWPEEVLFDGKVDEPPPPGDEFVAGLGKLPSARTRAAEVDGGAGALPR